MRLVRRRDQSLATLQAEDVEQKDEDHPDVISAVLVKEGQEEALVL